MQKFIIKNINKLDEFDGEKFDKGSYADRMLLFLKIILTSLGHFLNMFVGQISGWLDENGDRSALILRHSFKENNHQETLIFFLEFLAFLPDRIDEQKFTFRTKPYVVEGHFWFGFKVYTKECQNSRKKLIKPLVKFLNELAAVSTINSILYKKNFETRNKSKTLCLEFVLQIFSTIYTPRTN